VKTQVYLPEEELAALHRAAKRSGKSVAELVREAIRRVWLQADRRGPVALWDGKLSFTSQTVNYTLDRRKLDIVVHGSVSVAQALIENNLVDELRLMVFPVILGQGKRLFGDTSDKKALRLAESKTVGDSVTILVYRPAG